MNSTDDDLSTLCTTDEEIEPTPAPSEESVIELFQPVPYTFSLKDASGNDVLYNSDEINNVQVSCPPFHLLLDHVLAVLWILYSGERISVLQTSHLYWVLKFLEGLKDDQNKHTPDIEMVIKHLETILIDVYSQVNVDDLEKQNNKHRNEYSKNLNSLIGKSNKTYSDFKVNLEVCQEKNLMNPTPLKSCRKCVSDVCNSENFQSFEHHLNCPSYTLQDILEHDPITLQNILTNSVVVEEEEVEHERKSEEEIAISNTPSPSQNAISLMAARKDLCQKVREQLKCIDDQIQMLSAPELSQNSNASMNQKN